MSTEFIVKDSGERRHTSTGAQRDKQTGKGRFDLLHPIMLERLALLLEKGAVKYYDHNWETGMPCSWGLDSLLRHVSNYMKGDYSEDHLAAIIFNAMVVMVTEQCVHEGKLPAELLDIPVSGHIYTNKEPDSDGRFTLDKKRTYIERIRRWPGFSVLTSKSL